MPLAMQHTKHHQLLIFIFTLTSTFVPQSTLTSFSLVSFVCPNSVLLITHINFPIKYCKNSFVPGEITSCFLSVPLLEVTIYIKLQSSPVPSCFQLLQQPQLLPYCEIQSPFFAHIHYTELFTTESLHHSGSPSLKVNSLKTY